MLDIATVGAGGGSLAWVDDYGALKVGQESAGADPGPICYGRGGTQPTVTDAALVLGRLPSRLIGGALTLDAEAARAAFVRLGARFDLSPEETAAGVFEIAAANQVHGIRQVTTSRGREPGRYVLAAFGGAGGMFAAEVADFLAIGRILSPPDPGNLSAFGLHVSDIKRDYVRTLVRQQMSADAGEIDSAWRELERIGRDEVMAEGVPRERIELRRSADVRYVGEGHEVPVQIPQGVEGAEAAAMWSSFHRVHADAFGFDYEGRQDVEVVNLRVQVIGQVDRPAAQEIAAGDGPAVPEGERPVYWRGDGWIGCPIFRREALAPGTRLDGPLIVEEYGSTVVVPAAWRVACDRHGNLVMEKVR